MDYSYITAAETKTHVIAWCRDMSGVLHEHQYPIEDFLYAYVPDNTGTPDKKDIFGRPMKRVSFTDKWKFRDWRKTATNVCESDIQPAYRMLLDCFGDAPADSPFNVLYYDIEVDFDLTSGRGYPTPSNPYGEINSFQAFDAKRETYVIFTPESNEGKFHLSDKEYPVEVHFVRDERDLLLSVADYIDHVDVMIGWYTNGFDLPYIMERSIHHFGEKEATTMFCRGGFAAKRRDFINDYKESVWEWTLVGREHLDMRDIYKKFIPGEKESFSLASVCDEDLGETKDEYDGDLGELYRRDPQAFFEYAKQDARLLKLLDDKHGIVRLAMSLARMSCVFPRDVTGSVKPIETGFIKFCHERGIVVPDKKSHEKEDFPGAIVYDTIAGRHGWVFTVDLTALYPKTMYMLGLSTETLLGQLEGGYKDYIAVMTKTDKILKLTLEDTGEVIDVVASELNDAIRDAGYTISANGTIFTGELGLLSEYVQDRFNLRKKYQKQKKEYESKKDFHNAAIADLYQKVFKIVCNSLYGCISNAHFRLFDIRLAKSITLTARIISKWQAWKSNHELNKLAMGT